MFQILSGLSRSSWYAHEPCAGDVKGAKAHGSFMSSRRSVIAAYNGASGKRPPPAGEGGAWDRPAVPRFGRLRRPGGPLPGARGG